MTGDVGVMGGLVRQKEGGDAKIDVWWLVWESVRSRLRKRTGRKSERVRLRRRWERRG